MTKLEELLKLENLLKNEGNWQLHVAKTLIKDNKIIQEWEKELKRQG